MDLVKRAGGKGNLQTTQHIGNVPFSIQNDRLVLHDDTRLPRVDILNDRFNLREFFDEHVDQVPTRRKHLRARDKDDHDLVCRMRVTNHDVPQQTGSRPLIV